MRKSNTDKRTQRLVEEFPIGITTPRIGGYKLSYHAAMRMLARRIQAEWVVDALTQLGRPDGERHKHIGDYATCVVNHRNKIILTVGYGRLNMKQE